MKFTAKQLSEWYAKVDQGWQMYINGHKAVGGPTCQSEKENWELRPPAPREGWVCPAGSKLCTKCHSGADPSPCKGAFFVREVVEEDKPQEWDAVVGRSDHPTATNAVLAFDSHEVPPAGTRVKVVKDED